MRQLTSIVARNADGAIGAQNRLPWRVKNDLQFFRATTIDNVVVLGRRTHASLGRCLPKRQNVVVTHSFTLFDEGPNCKIASGIQEALILSTTLAGKKKKAFIIGGASMYEQFADLVDRYLITDIKFPVPDADTFFDNEWLGDPKRWTRNVLEQGTADGINNDADYEIVEYIARDAAEIAARREKLIESWTSRSHRTLETRDWPSAQSVIATA